MKDSLFLQSLNRSGSLQSPKRIGPVPKTESYSDPVRHQEAASEFSREYGNKKTPANDSLKEAGANNFSIDNSESEETHRLDSDMHAIETGIYRFPEGKNPFEAEIVKSEANGPFSTIKSNDFQNTAATIPDIKELIDDTINAPISPAESTQSDALTQEQLQALQLTETLTAQDDVVIAQTSQRHFLGIVEETVNPAPTRTNRQNANSETLSTSDIRTLEINDIELDTLEIEPEAAIDLVDIESQLATRIDNLSQQTVFPNIAQNTLGQPVIGLGSELVAPTVMSGVSSVSVTSQTNATVPSPIANAIVSTVADAILTAKETPKGVMVQLDPPEMGRVYIDFMFDADNRVNVVVKADNFESYNILRERSQDFLQMLGDNGFANIDLSFEQQSSDGGSSENDENAQTYGVSYGETAGDSLEASYRTPIYRVNEEQLRLDLRL